MYMHVYIIVCTLSIQLLMYDIAYSHTYVELLSMSTPVHVYGRRKLILIAVWVQ